MGNLYSIDLTIYTDFSRALISDNLEDTISYADAVNICKEEMKIESKLIEHVAGRIIKRIQNQWGENVSGIDIRIAKHTPPIENSELEYCAVHIII